MDRLVIHFMETPDSGNPEEIVRWFCTVFGLSAGKGSIEEQLLARFMVDAYRNNGISSTELSEGINMPRSTVIYHLNRFMDSGLVIKRGRKYYLRASEMRKTIEEIEYDIEREMRRMLDMAAEFDKLMAPKTVRARRVEK